MEYLGNSLDPSSTTFDGDITAVVKGKCVLLLLLLLLFPFGAFSANG